ncbi:MAG TPA: MFS transporter [Candidatus Lustribacter sp.]
MELIEYAEPLRYRSFLYYCCTRACTALAWQMVGVAVGWQMYDLTRSALALGFVGLAQFAPLLLLVFVIGHVADRFDRRHIARACELLEALAVIALCFATFYDAARPALIYAMVVLLGVGRAFESPASSALLPNLVPLNLIPAASARAATAQQVSTISGPAVGGILYAWHPWIPYGVAGAMFVIAAVLMTLMRTRGPSVSTSGPPTRDSVFAGLAFIRATPLVLGAITLDLFAVLLGGATALLPIYARDILMIGPWGLGLLRTAPAVGALSLSLVFGRYPIRRNAGRVMFGAVATFGLSTVVFGLSHSVLLSFVALVFLGASDVVSVVIRSSLVAILTPDVMRGRVNAVNSLFIGTSNQAGEFESGVTAALLGPVGAVVLGGVGTMLVAAVFFRLFPALAKIDAVDDVRSAA